MPKYLSGIPSRRAGHAMVFDSNRGVGVLVGGTIAGNLSDTMTVGDTWEWDGSDWTQRVSVAGPGPRENHAMAFDAARGVTVVFGGFAHDNEAPSALLADTRTWDGNTWTLASTNGPSARRNAAMAFDSVRNVVVLFGGEAINGVQGDTWEWNGLSWILRSTLGPPAQANHAMAFDSSTGRTVLIGQNQTWEWNGLAWTLAGNPIATPMGGGHALSYDFVRDVLVLSGGGTTGLQTYKWDGMDWTEAPNPYPARLNHTLLYDSIRDVCVLFGGGSFPFLLDDTWIWDGAAWGLAKSGNPHNFGFPAMAYDLDRNVTVMFGGLSEGYHGTWEFDGTNWTFRSHDGPGFRKETAIAYDEARGQTVLFGGLRCDETPPCSRNGETWVWDGAQWTLAATTGPSPRDGHVMAYDPDRRRVVLFGGVSSGVGLLSDTWEWDGATWTFLGADAVIPSRTLASMAYDDRRHVMVLFGGSTNSGVNGYLGDTWERTGITWTLRSEEGPLPRSFAAMAYDSQRGVVVMHGGGLFTDSETWEWKGVTWTPLERPGPSNGDDSMVYDTSRNAMVFFAGSGVDSYTWEFSTDYDFPSSAPRAENFPPCMGNDYAEKNRYISFVPPVVPAGASGIALRVTLGPMPGPSDCPGVPDFSAVNGAPMWVGQEVLQGGLPSGVFRLQLAPLFRDWTTIPTGVVQIADCNIVPCASYSIQSVSDVGFPNGLYSSPLILSTTAVWGDIVGANYAAFPNGIVDFIDISATVDTFKNAPSAPRTWCDLGGNSPYQGVTLNIDFIDVSLVVDAFRGLAYPFSGPMAPNSCP